MSRFKGRCHGSACVWDARMLFVPAAAGNVLIAGTKTIDRKLFPTTVLDNSFLGSTTTVEDLNRMT